MLVLLAAAGMLLNVARQEVWPVRASVLATTAQAERRSRRAPGGRQTPAQKAKADAEHRRARPRPPSTRTRREERR